MFGARSVVVDQEFRRNGHIDWRKTLPAFVRADRVKLEVELVDIPPAGFETL
jgi:hypothetical protein